MLKKNTTVYYPLTPPLMAFDHDGDEDTPPLPVWTGEEEWAKGAVVEMEQVKAGADPFQVHDVNLVTVLPTDGSPSVQVDEKYLSRHLPDEKNPPAL